MMLKEHEIKETMKKNLFVEREDERIVQQLYQEFSKIDLNQDGSLSMEEVYRYLNSKGNGQIERGLVEQLYAEIDENSNGVVPFEEFVSAYFHKHKSLRDRVSEIEN